jgi:hypothetical protein
MLSLRRFVLAALLTGLVLGCQSKARPVSSANKTPDEVAKERREQKLKMMQEAPEGPKLRP